MVFLSMRPVYSALYAGLKITENKDPKAGVTAAEVDDTVVRLMRNKGRYLAAQRASGLWWPIIGILHILESSGNFSAHLHNGDSLKARTVQVPAGRPKLGSAPFTWEESAADAISMKAYLQDQLGRLDTPEEICFYCENYNGWGYQTGAGRNSTPPRRSPYLWSGSNQWRQGKYVSDGSFDARAKSSQIGAAVLLKRMEQLGHIDFTKPEPENGNPPKMSPYVAAPVPLPFKGELAFGASGPEVSTLICALMGLKFLAKTEQVSDQFNLIVEDAVKWFQRSAKLDADGAVGPLTKAALESALNSARGVTSGLHKKLNDFYTTPGGYNDVYDDVMGWFGTTKNGCVAFLSTALRMSGCAVPKTEDSKGLGISLVTISFSDWLLANGFKKDSNPDNLKAGDLVLTKEDGWKGVPAHTYMFSSWADKAAGIAWIVDNQGPLHKRNVHKAGGGFNFTGYAYHLRKS